MASLIRLASALKAPLLNTAVRSFSVTAPANAKIAMVLAGCGVYDGSEVTEATSMMTHLTRAGAQLTVFAPNKNQEEVVDHTKPEPECDSNRNILQESARITRGPIKDLCQLNVCDYDALVIPGGFGIGKNLSTFATEGVGMSVDNKLSELMKAFHATKKPIGTACSASLIPAKVICGSEVTLGMENSCGGDWPYADNIDAIKAWGSTHISKDVNEVHVDKCNLIVSTPAFMKAAAQPHEVYDGIGKLVDEVLQLTNQKDSCKRC